MQARGLITGAVLLAALLGCRGREQTRTTTTEATSGSVAVERQAVEAQKQSEQALDEARKAQEKATEQQKEAASAQEKVKEKSAALNEARTEVQRERQEAQQTQQQAQQQAQQAQQTAQQAQQRALSAQQEAEQKSRRETTTGTTGGGQGQTMSAEGTVREIRADQLVLERTAGPALRLKINESVPVQSGGQGASLDQISVGSPVRIQYRMEANQPVAERIDLATSGSTIR